MKRTLRTHPYYPTCGFFRGSMYYAGFPLYVRKRDQSLFIIRNDRRVNVALVNTHGTVVLLAPDAIERSKTVLL